MLAIQPEENGGPKVIMGVAIHPTDKNRMEDCARKFLWGRPEFLPSYSTAKNLIT